MGVSVTKASELSVAIQARIEGLQINQVDVVNRLREKKVPEHLIAAAITAHEKEGTLEEKIQAYQNAEKEIIAWFKEANNYPEEVAVAFLNGAANVRYP